MKRTIFTLLTLACLQITTNLSSQIVESINEIESFQITFPSKARCTSKQGEPLSSYISLISPSHGLTVLSKADKKTNLAVDSLDQLNIQSACLDEEKSFLLYSTLKLTIEEVANRLYEHFQSLVEGDQGEESLTLQFLNIGEHLCVHLCRGFELFKINDEVLKEKDLLTYIITDHNVYFISSYGCQDYAEQQQHWELVRSLKVANAD